MNRNELKGKWHEMRMKVKQRWAKLTDDDLEHINGRHDELVGRLEQRYGRSRAEAERDVEGFYADTRQPPQRGARV